MINDYYLFLERKCLCSEADKCIILLGRRPHALGISMQVFREIQSINKGSVENWIPFEVKLLGNISENKKENRFHSKN